MTFSRDLYIGDMKLYDSINQSINQENLLWEKVGGRFILDEFS